MITFTADGKDFANAVSRAAAGLSSRPVNPIHAGMLINPGMGEIAITASDGEVTFLAKCDADVTGEDSVILPGRMTSEFSRYFGKSVSFESDGNSAVFISGKSRFSLSASPGAKFPKWGGFPDVAGKLDGEDFANAAKTVSVSSSRTDPVLRAIRMEISGGRLLMLSTDRSRMTLAAPVVTAVTLKADAAPPGAVLVPASVLERFSHVLSKDDEVSFGWSGGLAGVATEGLTVTSPQVSGTFVKGWEMIARDYPPEAPVDAAQLADAAKVASLAAGDRGTIGLTFGWEGIIVSASADAGYHSELEWLDGPPSGDAGIGILAAETRILEFTPKYLLDGIAIGKDQLSLSYTGRALLIRSGDVRYLVQPRRAVSTGE